MKHTLLIILPLLLFVGCEDEKEGDSTPADVPIYGLWEWTHFYMDSSWSLITPHFWFSLISEESYSERFLKHADSDSACYGDWSILTDSSYYFNDSYYPSSWEISSGDSATAMVYTDTSTMFDGDYDYVMTLKAVEDTLYMYNYYLIDDIPDLISKAVRIEFHDFTPECE